MQIRGIEVTTDEVCEAIIRHLELVGDELFEKNYIQGEDIVASVFAIVGPNADEVTAMMREWCMNNGFKRTR